MTYFVWTDIALVHCLCALPLAWLLACGLRRTAGRTATILLAVFAIALTIVIHVGLTEQLNEAASISFVHGIIVRTAVALLLTIAATLVVTSLPWLDRAAGARQWLALGVVALAACIVLPAVFVGARCRHDASKLEELIDQQRIGEAHALAEKLARLDPWRTVRDHHLANVEAILQQEVTRLESRVTPPLAASAPAAERLQRGRELAMLGRTDDALEALRPLTDQDADLLRGVIHEARGEWEQGLMAYENALTSIELQPVSDANRSSLKAAITGVAYCQRKAGRYDQAEVAYLKLLELAPTADTHFLLAQFYDDAQDAQKATGHARRAIELAPSRYRVQGERLIRKLQVSQFGCLRAL
jgi:hypothetical protein